MIVRRVLKRSGPLLLTEVQFIGVSGQVCSSTYELDGPEPRVFILRGQAEAAFDAGCALAEAG